jgi:hypothetical protein
VIIALALVVVLSPVGYVLSGGPVLWLAVRYPASERILRIGIEPIEFANRHGVFKSLGIEEALMSYYRWWFGKAMEQRQHDLATKPQPKAP